MDSNFISWVLPSFYSFFQICYSSHAPFAKSRFQRFPLLPMRLQDAMLFGCVCKTQCSWKWRSLRIFMQADFHASMKSATRICV